MGLSNQIVAQFRTTALGGTSFHKDGRDPRANATLHALRSFISIDPINTFIVYNRAVTKGQTEAFATGLLETTGATIQRE